MNQSPQQPQWPQQHNPQLPHPARQKHPQPAPKQGPGQTQSSPAFRRKRQFYLILPVMVLPALFLLFRSLGGGQDTTARNGKDSTAKGFNANLPGAHFSRKDKPLNKWQAYRKADADSARRRGYGQQDPYQSALSGAPPSAIPGTSPAFATPGTSPAAPSPTAPSPPVAVRPLPSEDPRADELLHKLDLLSHSIRSSGTAPHPLNPGMVPASDITMTPRLPRTLPMARTTDWQQRWQSLHSLDTGSAENDPQLERLNGMLDKIIRIQHGSPDNIEPGSATSTLAGSAPGAGSRPASSQDIVSPVAIPAVIQEDQVLFAGATVALRMTEPALIDGIRIPGDQLVYGSVAVSNDRMLINIHAIRSGMAIYTTALQVYDMDGLPGIHIPGDLSRDVAKESAGQGINSIGLTTLEPSIGAQAATAGIQAAKALLTRRVKLIRISVHAGYQVLLRNTNRTGSPGWLQPACGLTTQPQHTQAIPAANTWRPVDSPFASRSTPPVSAAAGDLTSRQPLPPFLHRSVSEGRMQLTLQGIYLEDQMRYQPQHKTLLFSFRISNRSPIDYVPAYSRWFIRDRRRIVRTAIQEIPISPVVNTVPETVPGDSCRSFLVAFEPFALPCDKELVWQLSEANGARLLTMTFEPGAIIQAKKIF